MDTLFKSIDAGLGAIPKILFAWMAAGIAVNLLAGATGADAAGLVLWTFILPLVLMLCFASVVVMGGLFLLLISWR